MGPLTTALLITGTVASGVYSANQQKKQAKAAQAQGEYEGQVFDLNAATADRLAEDAIARGEEAVDRHRTDVKRLIGSQRAALAASGVDINSGSAAAVQEDAAYLGELDAQTMLNNARREAFGYETQAANLRQQGQLARMGGRNTAAAYRQQATGTLLTTGLTAVSMGRDYWRGRS